MGTDELKLSSESGESGEMTILRETDSIEKVKQSLSYCFNDIAFAENYVDTIISLAVQELTHKPKTFKPSDIVSPIIDDMLSFTCQTEVSTFRGERLEYVETKQFPAKSSHDIFSGWPKVSDFNIKLGLEKLEEYIETWQKSEEWMLCVEFLGFESEESSNYFVYEVEFSIPTPMYPIPQATASVYFSLEVSKIVPPPHDGPIQVTYVFESSNVIHVPGRIDFQETWIKDLMNSKLGFFKTLTF